jgi:protein-L-isoaspartate(D-aspartate) O-methyltransferase
MWTDSQGVRYTEARYEMVETQLRRRGIGDERVLQAMSRVARHEFVPPEFKEQSYEDHPLPIGEGQTISQPYIVAIMLEALDLNSKDVVLEVGTGSGYLTALLAELCRHVYSVELRESLAQQARTVLQRLGYANVTVFAGDGAQGLPQYAPFHAVVASAAAAEVPQPLFAQLAEAGRMVIPVGPPETQQLQFIRKQAGNPLITVLEGCRFVPLLTPVANSKPIPA